ncbi:MULTISPECIES: tetratricopeptide repeat protein [Idiomarina]|jgi:type IV pilus assembly protein PilF|nr:MULTISPECIES: tetratricopeptide repeat protein [Idiomarina]KXS36434.1 MAG: type IV pilus assembly protein PilF [Idiomarina sp. T82-3]HAE89427.1 pilus assembly protein PilF [Idiomarina sp.]|tara:strand:+ start:734 stop:1144 length:411 start_codon:yes stop_codon:yes gene_type:complete
MHRFILGAIGFALTACSVSTDETVVDAHLRAGMAYLAQNQLDHAERHFKQAFLADPKRVDTVLALGHWYLRKERVNSALLLYQEALSWQPMSGVLHNNYAVALCLSGQQQAAQRAFAQAQRLGAQASQQNHCAQHH